MTDLLPVAEVAAALDVTEATLSRWRKAEEGPPWKTRGLREVYYPRDELVAWCEENRVIYTLPEPDDGEPRAVEG